MALSNPYQKYQQNSVTSAAPEELTHMLYNGGVKFIKQGIKYIEEKNMEAAHKALVRAQEIYVHLSETLNTEIELSANLKKLYDFIVEQITRANIKKDPAILKQILELAEDLRDTWKMAMEMARG
ncbi:flagellar export chaperone FliS [Desulfotruncus alcoholivorax]|uniref:flagellar export chaperone FliS n=1 Tax=Desulfotruncus alcoholivorax TaxID=265477 RepID=UPI00040C2357|nr:flagellar export chaperone FliS [Desulfotruncus alcoholivorax]